MVDVFLINPGAYADFLHRLELPESREGFFFSHMNPKAFTFLAQFFDHINKPINVVLEDYYIDEDYLDLYSNYYVFLYQDNTKFCKRVLLVDTSFDNDDQFYDFWYNKSGSELSERVLAIFVIPESSNKHISKAYINPIILINKPFSKIILSNISIDILGKRIHMYAFPFRQTDSEFLSCSEVSMQGVFDYYFNKHQGFNKELLSSLLNIKQELSKIHGYNHINGMDVTDICSVFRQKGYETVYYNVNNMFTGFTSIDRTRMLVNMFYPYVASGYPCLLLVNPKPGLEHNGHCLNCIGVVENYTLRIHSLTVRRKKSDVEKDFYAIQSSEYCSEIITIDDQTCLNYIQLSSSKKQDYKGYEILGTVIAVPSLIKMVAADAYAFAFNLMGHKPFSAFLADEDEDTFIISIFLAKSSEYVQYRVENSKEIAVKNVYVDFPMPAYLWICEYSTMASYTHNLADAELVLDATIALPNLNNTIVFLRTKNRFLVNDEEMLIVDRCEKAFKIFEPRAVYFYSK